MKRATHTPARDRAFGLYYAKRGTARVIREAERGGTPRSQLERLQRWRFLYAAVPVELKV